ncbi:hypothetical protein AK812_SmicGene39152 [Symbiodinium microadriaticum]|uniref:Uncharacterized protein n=1 Tax=Symbiodinium microadriaticum TaxID=2951 RepID=A0A1Q9CBY0_SYMMI|nr:hypothetical protein AK812_SmicGene39152 [Symbiodinium microadriaticum]
MLWRRRLVEQPKSLKGPRHGLAVTDAEGARQGQDVEELGLMPAAAQLKFAVPRKSSWLYLVSVLLDRIDINSHGTSQARSGAYRENERTQEPAACLCCRRPMLPADSYSSKSTVAEVGKSSVKAICPEECIGTKANKGQDTAQPRDEAGGVPVGGEAAPPISSSAPSVGPWR